MTTTTNILVTGGAGFIGSNFIHYLYANHPEHKIYNLDILTYAGNPENLEDIEKKELNIPEGKGRYVFIKGDVSDEEFVTKLFDETRFAYVFHFAAESHVDRSFFNFSNFARTNVEGAVLLASMMQKHGGEMVHISTDEVYGSIPEGFVDENAPIWPSNPYATSKAAADMLLQSFMKTYKTPVCIVRATNNYGPYQYPEKLIPLAITNLLEDKKIPVHGSGQHLRQWLHVEDFSRAIYLVSQKGTSQGIYNVAGEHYTNIEVLTMIAKHLGKDIDKYKEHTPDRLGADYRYAIDSTKIEKELGWKRAHKFVDALPKVIAWYANNELWWRKIKRKKEFTDHYEKQARAKYY